MFEQVKSPGLFTRCPCTVEWAFAKTLYAAEDLAGARGWTLRRFTREDRRCHGYRLLGVPPDERDCLPVYAVLRIEINRRYPHAGARETLQQHFWSVKARGSRVAQEAFDALLKHPCGCEVELPL